MYNRYFEIEPVRGKTLITEQKSQQYRGYNKSWFDINVLKENEKITLKEYTYSYSDPDGIWDDEYKYELTLDLSDKNVNDFYVFYIDEKGSQRLMTGNHNLKNGWITLVSTDKVELEKEKVEEELWKILWIYKYTLHSFVKIHTIYSIRACEDMIRILLNDFLGLDLNETHCLIFHKFYFDGDKYEGEIEKASVKYKWNEDELKTIGNKLIEKVTSKE